VQGKIHIPQREADAARMNHTANSSREPPDLRINDTKAATGSRSTIGNGEDVTYSKEPLSHL
jgi:hypothetical protein